MTVPFAAIAASTIVAQAFRSMEIGPVSSFGDDSEQASAAAEQYPHALKMLLEGYDWSFARKMARLPLRADGDVSLDPDLPYLYTLPDDCVSLRHVVRGSEFAWRIEGRNMRAAQADAIVIRYTSFVARESDLPSVFQLAVALQLAVLLAPRFVGSRTKTADLKNDMDRAVQAAILADAQTASHARLDGRSDQPDWADEART